MKKNLLINLPPNVGAELKRAHENFLRSKESPAKEANDLVTIPPNVLIELHRAEEKFFRMR